MSLVKDDIPHPNRPNVVTEATANPAQAEETLLLKTDHRCWHLEKTAPESRGVDYMLVRKMRDFQAPFNLL